MQERHHVKTTPGEPHAAPEYTPHPVRKEDGHDVQTDDINIPLVAMLVAFFGVVLAITIVSLQAWFYHSQAAEIAAKWVPQESRGTELGDRLAAQRALLHLTGLLPDEPVKTPTTTTAPSTKPAQYHVSIDSAMKLVLQDYAKP